MAILNDLDTHTLLMREATLPGRSTGSGMNSIFRYILALRRWGINADIVTTGGEIEPKLDSYQLIIAPNVLAMSPATAQTLATAVERGAHLWADGFLGLKHPTGRLASPAPLGLAQVFGARLAEIRKLEQPLDVRLGKLSVRAEGTAALLANDSAEPLAQWNESTIATTRQHGQGRATWIGLTLTEGTEDTSVATLAALLAQPLAGLSPLGKWGLRPGRDLLTRTMRSAQHELLLIINPTTAAQRLDLPPGVRCAGASEGSTLDRVGGGGWIIGVMAG